MNGWKFVANPPFSFDLALQARHAVRWQQLQQQLPLGTVLTGQVFARAAFGVFYDAGIGFPVLMKVVEFGLQQTQVAGITERDQEGYPALGSVVSGQLADFSAHQQVIAVRL